MTDAASSAAARTLFDALTGGKKSIYIDADGQPVTTPVIIDRNVEMVDGDASTFMSDMASVLVDDVPLTASGDVIETTTKRYTVARVIFDDGVERRMLIE